jgi:hypothetical protein
MPIPAAPAEDPRDVPPLGYCTSCLQRGTWLRAATLWQGTSYCGEDFLRAAGVDVQHAAEHGSEGVEAVEKVRQMLKDELRPAAVKYAAGW